MKSKVEMLAWRFAAAALQASVLIVLARTTSLETFGAYSAGYGLSIVLAAVANLGLPAWLLRLPAEDRSRSAQSVVSATQILTLCSAGLSCLGTYVLTSNIWIALAVGAAAALDLTVLTVQNFLFGRNAATAATRAMAGIRLAAAVPLFVAALTGGDAITTYAVGASSAVVATVAVLAGTRSLSPPTRSSFTGGLSYWSVSTTAMAQQLDVPIIATLMSTAFAAPYAAAFRLASPVHIVTSLISSVYIPVLSGQWRADSSRIPSSARTMLRASASYAAVIMLAAPFTYWIGPWLLGAQYESTAIIFPLLFAAAAISVANQSVQNILYSVGRARLVLGPTAFVTVAFLLAISLTAFARAPLPALGLCLISAQIVLLAMLVWQLASLRKRNRI